MKIENETPEETLLRIAERLSKKYWLAGYESEDLAQDFYMLGMPLLAKFEESRAPLENFLNISLNRLAINFIESKTHSQKPSGCPEGCNCKKCKFVISKTNIQRMVQMPEELDVPALENTYRNSLEELIPILNLKLPASMRQDWRKILDGGKVVKSRREEIFEEIRELLKEYEEQPTEWPLSTFEFGWENGYFFVENEEHFVKIYMDEEAASIWLGTLCGPARQIYLKIRGGAPVNYDEILVLAKSIELNDMWEI